MALVVLREAGEALALHLTPDDTPWWGATHDPDDVAVVGTMISTIRTADERDITAAAKAFDVEDQTATPLDESFGGVLWALNRQVGGERAVLMARDAVERTWLAWRFEDSKLVFVEETPGYFDEHLKFIDAVSRESFDEHLSKPPLRLAHVGAPRRVRMPPEVRALMQEQAAAFREKFGRDMTPEDPVFFDPDADEPQLLSTETVDRIVALAEEAGLGKEFLQQRDTALAASGQSRRVGRNDACPCGSGKKYKRCHGA